MPINDLVIRVGGESGEGIVTIGEIFARIAAFSGLEVFTFRTFPAEIMGGHVMFQARIGRDDVLSQGDACDALVAMNDDGCERHVGELRPGGVLVYDSNATQPCVDDYVAVPIPVANLARELNFMRGKNLIMIGALVQLFGLPMDKAEEVVERRMGRYEGVLEQNMASFRCGVDYVRQHFPERPPIYLEPPTRVTVERLVLTGNQAIALGALAAGCRFYAGYPITPATDIMEFLAPLLPKVGGTLIQAEDEIAAITMCLGASFAGRKAMTATSGPGLSLMIESIGHASMTETPVVVVDVQRAGPSTGMPTKTSQGDLAMALYASNDDAPRFVIAPASVEDCFYQTVNAFNLAERYQMPVLILTDQAMATRIATVRPFRLDGLKVLDRIRPDPTILGNGHGVYKRYRLTPDGVSPMAIPGMKGGQYVAEGLEHLETGAPDYEPETHRRMMDKRFQKVETAREDLRTWDVVNRWGDPDAYIGILSWGSNQGAIREAMARAAGQGIRVAALFPKLLTPVPDKEIREFLHGKRAIIVPELNLQGQFAKVIEHRYNQPVIHFNKYDGLPFTAADIYQEIMKIADDLVSGVVLNWRQRMTDRMTR
jgi:2-oxoglutarate ferredoxin oxidoreductase subunit alpha